jgi:hypothetical protein
MGSVVELSRRRPAASKAVPKPRDKSTREAEESRRSLIVLVGTFTLIAVVMSVVVVITAASSWAEAVPMILTVLVFALAKVFLADAAFFGILKADAISEAKEAKRREERSIATTILRRPRFGHGKFTGTPLAARPKDRRGQLALLVRKQPNERGPKR